MAIGVHDAAGIGVVDTYGENDIEDDDIVDILVLILVVFEARTMSNPPPGSDGNWTDTSFASAWLFSGRKRLPGLVVNSGDVEDGKVDSEAEGTAADSTADEFSISSFCSIDRG